MFEKCQERSAFVQDRLEALLDPQLGQGKLFPRMSSYLKPMQLL